MSDWAQLADVRARLTYRKIDSDSKPNATQVQAWLDEAEGLLKASFNAIEISDTYAAGNPVLILRTWVTDYVEGRVKMAYASADGSGDNTDGEEAVTNFRNLLEDIFQRPQWYANLLGEGTRPESASQLKSAFRNLSDKTIADGDFDPVFTTTEKF